MKSRNEKEMLDLIVGTAIEDDAIRACILEGSKANPFVKKDPFQDYDVIYAVRELGLYKKNREWIKRFGDLMILQMPDEMGIQSRNENKFTYLMQFTDGNRIDLNFHLVDYLKQHTFDSQRVILLDKDSLFTELTPTSEDAYLPKKPGDKEFFDCCNEFWWVVPYVAKGLWRDNIGYARYFLEHILREEVMKMMTWYFGVKTDYSVSAGKRGVRFHEHIEQELCKLFESTYLDSNIKEIWQALEGLCEIFRKVGKSVASHFTYTYPDEEDRNVSAHVFHVRNLAKDSKRIY